MRTAALAAYIQSRNMRFAGAPVTLGKLLRMWQLPHDGTATVIDGEALDGVARFCKMSVAELAAAVDAMAPVPAPEPAPMPEPVPAAPVPLPTPPEPTVAIPTGQLSDLVAASRESSPVIEMPAPELERMPDDHEIDVSFDDVEATPVPEAASEASSAGSDPKSADAKSGKSKKSRKKKS